MSDPTDQELDSLERLLGDVLDVTEGPPGRIVDIAVELYAMRRVGDDLMQLVEDSRSTGLAVRGGAGRVLAFEAEGCRLDLEVEGGTIVGEVDGVVTLQLILPTEVIPIRPDDL